MTEKELELDELLKTKTDISKYLKNRKEQIIEVTLEELVELIKECNFEWHNIDAFTEEFVTAKSSYDKVTSCHQALIGKYYKDPVYLKLIKNTYNKYAPKKYHLE
jgi:hypothetical protein